MRYMLLIYGEEAAMTEEDQRIEPWMEYTKNLIESGCYLAGDGLLPTETATTVRVRNGERLITDGPFAETKEQLGGYYLVDCPNLDEAIEWAGKIPNVGKGSIEVRPVMDVPEPS